MSRRRGGQVCLKLVNEDMDSSLQEELQDKKSHMLCRKELMRQAKLLSSGRLFAKVALGW